MSRAVTALLSAALACIGSATAAAQRATPVAVTALVPPEQGGAALQIRKEERQHPRPLVVAPIALAVGVAGGLVGYHAAEQSCKAARNECWNHFAYVPIGYVGGVALGGGLAGIGEGCRSGLLRSTAGALVGFAAGVATTMVAQPLALVALPVGPALGATLFVARCRTRAQTAATDSDRRG